MMSTMPRRAAATSSDRAAIASLTGITLPLVVVVALRPRGVARHFLGAQKRRDPVGFVEGFVPVETQVGREFKRDPPRHFLAQHRPYFFRAP